MPDRPPPMQRKIDMRKVIDLSKLSLDKIKSLFKKSGKKDRKAISGHIHWRHTEHSEQMMKAKKRRISRRRNEIAKEPRRRNR